MTGWVAYFAARVLLRLARLVPLSLASRLGGVLGAIAYRVDGRHRKVGLRNLELAFGKDPFDGRAHRRLLLDCYGHLATSLLEMAHLPSLDATSVRRWVRYADTENYEAARARGSGILLLTAHIGNFDLMAFAHSMLRNPVLFVSRPLDNARLYAHINSARVRFGNRIIDKDQKKAARQVIEALMRGEVVGILADQNAVRSEGVFVNFFGRQASAFAGPARIALMTGCAVVPVFIVRENLDGTHVIYAGREIEVARTGNRRADVRETTQRFQTAIEEFIRRYPDQWFWVHRRWKTRPPGEARLY